MRLVKIDRDGSPNARANESTVSSEAIIADYSGTAQAHQSTAPVRHRPFAR